MKPQTMAGAHACWLLKHVLEKLGLCFIGKDDTNGAKRERAAPAASPTGASQEEQLRTSLGARGYSPMALRKFSISTSVFLISVEYTSLPTIGQKGTLLPSS